MPVTPCPIGQLGRPGWAPCQQQLHVALKRRELLLDGVPDQGVIDQVITVDQHVAKGDDLGIRTDPVCGGRVMVRKPLDGLADDLEVAHHGLAQQPIGAVLRQLAARGHLANEGCRVADVFKQLR